MTDLTPKGQILAKARELWKKDRTMEPFGFDWNGVAVEVHPEPSRLESVVRLRVIAMAEWKGEVKTKELGVALGLVVK